MWDFLIEKREPDLDKHFTMVASLLFAGRTAVICSPLNLMYGGSGGTVAEKHQ